MYFLDGEIQINFLSLSFFFFFSIYLFLILSSIKDQTRRGKLGLECFWFKIRILEQYIGKINKNAFKLFKIGQFQSIILLCFSLKYVIIIN